MSDLLELCVLTRTSASSVEFSEPSSHVVGRVKYLVGSELMGFRD